MPANAPEIPLDIREQMRDCILAIFWPKAKIVEFLVSAGCNSKIIPSNLDDFGRPSLITEVFSKLIAREDRGHATFQAMIDRLYNWTYFDKYWFDTMAKLDRAEADRNLASLKAAVDQRNKAVSNQRRSSAGQKRSERNTSDLSALVSAFSKMFGNELTPQARGKFFEKFLKTLFESQGVAFTDPLRIVGEEIDGSFKFDGENYIVEAKWQDGHSSTEQLYKFAVKADGKMYGRGLFISVNGFTGESFKGIVHGKHIKTILVDGADITHVLEGRLSLTEMLDYKVHAAQTKGLIYVCAVEKIDKAA